MSGWTRFYDAVGDEPNETLLIALDRWKRDVGTGHDEPFAVDLGCGSGMDTLALLARGWRVLAIDADPEGIDRLSMSVAARGDVAHLLDTRVARFEDATWPRAQLVNASYALPFCQRESFEAVWERVVGSLDPGGRFCGQFFGDRDEWASPPEEPPGRWGSPRAGSFHTRDEVLELLGELEIEHFDEVDEDGETAVGDPKHWHLFHVVARKR
jgi:tellurite methyltransferase